MGAVCCTPKGVDTEPGINSEGGFRTADETPKRYLTSEELVDALTSCSQEVGPGGKVPVSKGSAVSINISVIETILLDIDDPQPVRRSSVGRKGTGFVSAEEVQSAMAKVGFEEQEDAGQEGRVKARKGTGFVTKEKLLEVLADDSEEEDVDDVDKKLQEQAAAEAANPGERIKARKGTGFVSKGKLKKVLDMVGEAED